MQKGQGPGAPEAWWNARGTPHLGSWEEGGKVTSLLQRFQKPWLFQALKVKQKKNKHFHNDGFVLEQLCTSYPQFLVK